MYAERPGLGLPLTLSVCPFAPKRRDRKTGTPPVPRRERALDRSQFI
jgi:hypothetical protein